MAVCMVCVDLIGRYKEANVTAVPRTHDAVMCWKALVCEGPCRLKEGRGSQPGKSAETIDIEGTSRAGWRRAGGGGPFEEPRPGE